MAAPILLVASLVTFSDERVRAPAAPQEKCVELRQFRANGGCRVAVDRALAWMCLSETAEKGKEPARYHVTFKTDEGGVVKAYDYDQLKRESWSGHVEIFYMSQDPKKNPDLKIGLSGEGKDATVVIGKGRHCMPAQGAQAFK